MVAVVFCFQRLVSEIETQTNGIVAIVDVKDFALQHLRQFTPPLIKIIAEIVQVKLNYKLEFARIIRTNKCILLKLFTNAERVSYSFARNSCPA